MFITLVLATLILSTLVFSYAWLDHGLMTMVAVSKPFVLKIDPYRAYLLYNRHVFEKLFILLLLTFLVIQLYFLLKKNLTIKHLPVVTALFVLIASLAYPFLSTDIFGYLFSAKIFAIYHQNPYTTIPEVFRNQDIWISFTQWTHRIYVYGPFYLLYSSALLLLFSIKRFITVFLAFKLTNGLLFFLTGYGLLKEAKNKNLVYAIWFFNPLLIFELLINSHNDMVMIAFFCFSLLLLNQKKRITSYTVFLLSVLTKFVSVAFLPYFFLKDNHKEIFMKLAVIGSFFIMGYKYETVQVWYYTWCYMAIPFANLNKKSLIIIFITQIAILFDKYYIFVGSGGWRSVNLELFQIVSLVMPILILITEREKIFHAVPFLNRDDN